MNPESLPSVATDTSMLALFWHAGWIVKFVMLLLIG